MKVPLFLAMLLCAETAVAEEVILRPIDQPADFELSPIPGYADELQRWLEEQKLAPARHQPVAYSDAESSADHLEWQLNQALLDKNWAELERLLEAYSRQPDHDSILYAYMRGAWLRQQTRYPEAIAQYREVLERQPELAYPRFDYGVMLFENHQYREAEAQLVQAKQDIQPAMQQLVDAYLEEMQKRQAWRPAANLYYVQTDNVNNAALAREIDINGVRFLKDSDSLPQAAHGLGYGLGLGREVNIGGNHFVAGNVHYGGIHYWDRGEYSEQSLRLDTAYRRRAYRDTWGLMPFAVHNWLGGSSYSTLFGVRAEYARRLDDAWWLAAEWTHTRKHYAVPATARRFNGFANTAGAVLMWQPEQAWHSYGGVDISREHTRDPAESSWRYSVRGGLAYAGNNMSSSISLQYGHRRFDAPHFLYGRFRRDDEYQLLWSMWSRRLAWRGMVPKLNYRYQKTDSNLFELYSRAGGAWFMTVEKVF